MEHYEKANDILDVDQKIKGLVAQQDAKVPFPGIEHLDENVEIITSINQTNIDGRLFLLTYRPSITLTLEIPCCPAVSHSIYQCP